MGHRIGDFVFQRPVLPFKFRKMRLHGHNGVAPKAVSRTPLTRSVCHEATGKSIATSCALQKIPAFPHRRAVEGVLRYGNNSLPSKDVLAARHDLPGAASCPVVS